MRELVGNLLGQLGALYSSSRRNDGSGASRPFGSFRNVKLATAFASVGEGLAVLLVLDEILKENRNVRGYLSLFARMLNNVKLEADSFGISVGDIDFLNQVVSHLEKLLDDGLFQGGSSWHNILQQVKSNRKMVEACTSCICDGLSEILPRLDTWKEYPSDRRKILDYVALFLFSTHVSVEAPEKKTGNLIVEMLQLVPVLYVEGGKRIFLLDLLKNQGSQSLSSWPPMRITSKDSDIMKRNYLMRLSELHLRDWQAIKDLLSCWVGSFQSSIHPSSETMSEACLRLHLKQIMQGIFLANRVRILVLSMLDLHAFLEVPIKREKLKSLSHMVTSLKVFGTTCQIKGMEIIRSLPHVLNVIQADIEQLILPLKAKLHAEVIKESQLSRFVILSSLKRGGRDKDTRLSDSLTLVRISLQLLQGGGSSMRQFILSITLDVLQSIGHIDFNFPRIRKHMLKLAVVADFQTIVDEVTNCSFLYWRKEMIESWLSMVFMDVTRLSLLQPLLDAFSDGLWLLKTGHAGKRTIQSYEKEVESTLKKEIIDPLCRDIETDIRLHVHSTQLRGSVYVNPTQTGVRNLSWYLQMRPLRLPCKFVDVRSIVESYLNSAVYNHTAMSSSDWKIYSAMQQLAQLKYGVALDDIHLSEYSISQDFDINKVVQDLDTFSEKYTYSMVNQIFIEKAPNRQGRKNMRLIDVEHVASSMGIHGLKTIQSASTSIFDYLSQMLTTLAETLKDKYVRSHLMQEPGCSRSDKGKISIQSLVQHGDLNNIIRKIPLEENYLEQLQYVVTKIGNALGLMRILIAGASRHSCNISRFISRPSCNMSYVEGCVRLGSPSKNVGSEQVMDIAVKNKYTFDDKTNSFPFMINCLSKEHMNDKCDHLVDFFLIVPQLILRIVESKVHYNDAPLRREYNSGNMVSAYDGFAMGVAYVLKVTGQDKSFDELDWFASAKRNLEEAVCSLEETIKGPEQRVGSSLAGLKLWNQAPPTSSEAQKGIDKHKRWQKEIELIECCFNVARTILAWN